MGQRDDVSAARPRRRQHVRPSENAYLPTHKPDVEPFAQILEGGALDWRSLPVADTAPPKRIIRRTRGHRRSERQRRAAQIRRTAAQFRGHDRQHTPGERHAVILAKARAAGGLRAYLDYDEIMGALLDAAEQCGEVEQYGEDDVRRTIEDGISYGEDEPWTPEQLGEAPQAKLTRHQDDEKDDQVILYQVPEFPKDVLLPSFGTVRRINAADWTAGGCRAGDAGDGSWRRRDDRNQSKSRRTRDPVRAIDWAAVSR